MANVLQKFFYGTNNKEEVSEIPEVPEVQEITPPNPEAEELLAAINDCKGGIYTVQRLLAKQPGLSKETLLDILDTTEVSVSELLTDAEARIAAIDAEVERICGVYETIMESNRSKVAENQDLIARLGEKSVELERDTAHKAKVSDSLKVLGAQMKSQINVLKGKIA